MQEYSHNTRRIAKNTLMLYSRMLFSMIVSLYTSRVVINALGVVDYGIYGVVGGFVTMFALISNSLSSAVSRFMTFAIGKSSRTMLNEVFSMSLFIHVLLAVLVVILAETIGVWFVNNRMTIPVDRLHAANWAYQASVLSFVFKLLMISYNALIISHEDMKVFAYIGMLDVTLRLLVVLFVAYIGWHFDKLIIYSILLVVVSISIQAIYYIYCKNNYDACRVNRHLNTNILKEISGFAGWNFIGCSAQLLKDQGVNVLLNIFGGPVLNAARGVATSVNTAVSSFTSGFMTALNPQITKSYASSDFSYMFSLMEKGARFSFYILMMLAFPVILETEFILTIWLKTYPDHTIGFVRLVLLLSLCDILSRPLMTAQLATGKIRNYQIVVGGVLLMNFPLSYCFLKLNFPPEYIYIVAISISLLCLVIRLFFLKRMINLSIRRYLTQVVCNVLIVSLIAILPPYLMHNNMQYGMPRFLVIGFLSVICSACSIYFVGCTKNERVMIWNRVTSIFKVKK